MTEPLDLDALEALAEKAQTAPLGAPRLGAILALDRACDPDTIRRLIALARGLDVEMLGKAIVEHRTKFWANEPCVANCGKDVAAEYERLREPSR
jgi:hypothetical protein